VKTWAISPYCGEADVLEIKLATMAPLIDRFVLAEATVNQRGQEKPLHNPLEDERFAAWHDKITYIVAEDMPVGEGWDADWQRERHQRNELIRGMADLAPEDVVCVSDLDEIPRPEALAEAIANPPMRMLMDLHVYRLNWRWRDRDTLIGTLCMTMTGYELLTRQPNEGVSQVMLNMLGGAGPRPTPAARPGSGWHLTYQGDIPWIRRKMTGIADNFWEQLVPEWAKAQWNKETFLTDEWIQESIDTGRDIYAREYRPSDWVDVDELPPYVAENRDRFAHMLVPKPA
jgi:beta-1,4-mannosyl-glycoprotein beta-1,4-N-acetylglucosaminyltransferase